MALKMTDREVNGVTVVTLDGRIVFGEETNLLREKVKALLDAGKKKLVLNIGGVSFIDSSGLGTLVGLRQSATAQGASLWLSNLTNRSKQLFQIAQILFDISETEAEAVRSLSQ
jgi:anti-sigma B factor antagonist